MACSWILMKMWVLVHPQLGLLCGAALPGAFFLSEKPHFWENTLFVMIFEIFSKIDLICY